MGVTSYRALWDLALTRGSTLLTCCPLVAVRRITHLLPLGLVLRLHLLAGHVAAEAGLDLSGGPVGLRIVQWDVHDVLLLLGPAALLLLKESEGFFWLTQQYYMFSVLPSQGQ